MVWLRSYTRPILLLILLQTLFTATQNGSNIPVGQSLPATINGSPWLSPSGDFAFGFLKLPDCINLFLLSIWYTKIPDTIVWYANNGTSVPEESIVKITANEGLVLSDPQGHNIWNSSNELANTGESYGVMNDIGNYALKTSNNNNPVWQSLDHPTNTLLPGQLLKINGTITSRRSKTSFAQGRFQLSLILVEYFFNARLGPRYWPCHDPFYNVNGNITQDGPNKSSQGLIFNDSGYMYLLMKDGSTYDLIPAIKTLQATKYYQRETLEYDGVLAFYTVPKSSADDGWSTLLFIPDDICITSSPNGTDSGICGFISICSICYNLRPICSCLEGHALLDPNNAYGSCVPNFKLGVSPVMAKVMSK